MELQAKMSMLASLLTLLTHPRANDYEHMTTWRSSCREA